MKTLIINAQINIKLVLNEEDIDILEEDSELENPASPTDSEVERIISSCFDSEGASIDSKGNVYGLTLMDSKILGVEYTE